MDLSELPIHVAELGIRARSLHQHGTKGDLSSLKEEMATPNDRFYFAGADFDRPVLHENFIDTLRASLEAIGTPGPTKRAAEGCWTLTYFVKLT